MSQFTAKVIDIETGEKSIIVNDGDAQELMLRLGDRVKLVKDGYNITALVDISDSMVKTGEIGVYKDLLGDFPAEDGDRIDLSLAPTPPSVEFIRKKMKGETLNKAEILSIVKDTISQSLSQLEIAAFLMAQQYLGMKMD